jgi:hypothetical protein
MSPFTTKKHKSNHVNGENGSPPATQVVMTRSASNNYRSDRPTNPLKTALKKSNSRKDKSKRVAFDKTYTYTIDRIYSPQGDDIKDDLRPEVIEIIKEKIRNEGLTCNEENIDEICNQEFKRQFFITNEDITTALREKQIETPPFSKWNIHNVTDNDNNKWCTAAGKVCLYGGLFILGHVIAKSLGGKKKSKKTKTRKMTRK